MFSGNFDAISYILYLLHWTLDVYAKIGESDFKES